MRLILAPMEGLADPSLRDILTHLGGIDLCVAEFVRVTNHLLSEKRLLRTVPELASGGCTRAGVPVRVQLLGSDPVCLAENAAFIAGLGAPGIDLNFGCPAPTVNLHGGGAVLLQYPERIRAIVAAARRAVPAHIPVTAKMRLGLEDTSLTLDCARAIEAGGADEITVHARTRADRYRPPARWEWLAHIRETVKLPVVANGEVWTPQDWENIRQVSGCSDVMIGRGAIARPDLMRRIKTGSEAMPWPELLPWIADFYDQLLARMDARHAPGRLKQWLGMMRSAYPEAEALHRTLRVERDPVAVGKMLATCLA
ncbi:MAG: tRNA-dihydrouridine synthase family protein [Betaproteobacteria bacterium]|nr:tRNA-dihydrouridine synthase family protein [Betaproteobacteria bacterium]